MFVLPRLHATLTHLLWVIISYSRAALLALNIFFLSLFLLLCVCVCKRVSKWI